MPTLDNNSMQGNSAPLSRYEWIAETPYLKNRANLRRRRNALNPSMDERNNYIAKAVLQRMYREYSDLQVSLINQWNEKGSHFNFQDKEVIRITMSKSIGWLQLLGAKGLKCEVTNDESVMLKAKISDSNVYWEVFFSDDETEQYEIIVNVYKDKEHVLATGGSILEVAGKLAAYNSKPEHSSYAPEYV